MGYQSGKGRNVSRNFFFLLVWNFNFASSTSCFAKEMMMLRKDLSQKKFFIHSSHCYIFILFKKYIYIRRHIWDFLLPKKPIFILFFLFQIFIRVATPSMLKTAALTHFLHLFTNTFLLNFISLLSLTLLASSHSTFSIKHAKETKVCQGYQVFYPPRGQLRV